MAGDGKGTDMTPEQTVDRYTVTRNGDGLGFSNGIEPDAAGGFVSYEDYLAQREQIEALQKRVKAARGALGDIFDGEPQWPNKPKKELTWCRKRAEEAYYAIGDAP